MRLFIVRHGQTAWNISGRAQGHTDIPLDEIGLNQARALAASFGTDVPIPTVYSSDLQRAAQTAQPLADLLNAELILRTELRERCFGVCEGLDYSDMFAKLTVMGNEQNLKPFEVTPPGGESYPEVWTRLGPIVQELRTRTEPAIVVTHGGTGALLLAHLLHGSVETARSFSFGNTALTELERRDDGFYKIVRFNDMSHLSRELASAP